MYKIYKAAALGRVNQSLKSLELKISKLIASQLIMKNISSGVCHSKLMEVLGLCGHDKWVSHLLGYDALNYISSGVPERSLIRLTNGKLHFEG
jgi:hypothetical protein